MEGTSDTGHCQDRGNGPYGCDRTLECPTSRERRTHRCHPSSVPPRERTRRQTSRRPSASNNHTRLDGAMFAVNGKWRATTSPGMHGRPQGPGLTRSMTPPVATRLRFVLCPPRSTNSSCANRLRAFRWRGAGLYSMGALVARRYRWCVQTRGEANDIEAGRSYSVFVWLETASPGSCASPCDTRSRTSQLTS